MRELRGYNRECCLASPESWPVKRDLLFESSVNRARRRHKRGGGEMPKEATASPSPLWPYSEFALQ